MRDSKLKSRCDLGDFIRSVTTVGLPSQNAGNPIIDFEVSITGETCFLALLKNF
jgi:dynein heavy chain 1, cytosolic